MRIAQITDVHLTERVPDAYGYDGAAALAAVLARVGRLDPRPELAVFTGDIGVDGTAAEYRRFLEIVADFPMPMAAVPGNHDERETFAEVLASGGVTVGAGGFLSLALDLGPLRALLLDTLAPGHVAGGMLGAGQLAWTAAELAAYDARPVMIFMHHPPFLLGRPLSDATFCEDGDALGELVARHPRVLAVACGHVHRSIHRAWAGTLGIVARSVAWEVPLSLPPGAPPRLVPQRPGFHLYDWSPERGLVSDAIVLSDADLAGG